MTPNQQITIERDYMISLLKDLGNTSAWAVYLYLWTQSMDYGKSSVARSTGQIMDATGFSKSTVQSALRLLNQRGLVTSQRNESHKATIHELHVNSRLQGTQ
jgi:DNA-binding MarR family transcriptional regulator